MRSNSVVAEGSKTLRRDNESAKRSTHIDEESTHTKRHEGNAPNLFNCK